MFKINQIELRSAKYAVRQYVSETHDHKPDRPTQPVRPTVMVLDEGKPGKRSEPITWLPMPSGNWLKIVRDQRLHLNRRIYRVELYDSNRTTRLAVFRRATEAVR
jgi:hypothetical protein